MGAAQGRAHRTGRLKKFRRTLGIVAATAGLALTGTLAAVPAHADTGINLYTNFSPGVCLRPDGSNLGSTVHLHSCDGSSDKWEAQPAVLRGGLLGFVFKGHRILGHGGVIRRHELTDHEWELLVPLIPRAATGCPRVKDRQVVNGMVYKIRAGVSWRDLLERYGPWKTVCTRFRRCALDGVFKRALQETQAQADEAGGIGWLVQVDSTIVRVHQHAAATAAPRIVPGARGRSHVLHPASAGPSPPASTPRRPGRQPAPNPGGDNKPAHATTKSCPVNDLRHAG
ncbi:transposase [Streptomyces sp. NPDC001135]